MKVCKRGFTVEDYARFYASGLILKAEYESMMTERFPGEPLITAEELKALQNA